LVVKEDAILGSVSEWELNLESRTLTLEFDEVINSDTFDAKHLTIQSVANFGNADDEYTLTTSATSSSDGTQP
jgi:hypothetical protein